MAIRGFRSREDIEETLDLLETVLVLEGLGLEEG